VNIENAFFDKRLGPNMRQQFVLRDQPPRLPQQHNQHIVGLRRQANGFGAAQQPPLSHVQRELVEMKYSPASHSVFGQS